MQALSQTIRQEDNSYRPPFVKYETPDGFDLMDLMAFADHGQPYEWFHTLPMIRQRFFKRQRGF